MTYVRCVSSSQESKDLPSCLHASYMISVGFDFHPHMVKSREFVLFSDDAVPLNMT